MQYRSQKKQNRKARRFQILKKISFFFHPPPPKSVKLEDFKFLFEKNLKKTGLKKGILSPAGYNRALDSNRLKITELFSLSSFRKSKKAMLIVDSLKLKKLFLLVSFQNSFQRTKSRTGTSMSQEQFIHTALFLGYFLFSLCFF